MNLLSFLSAGQFKHKGNGEYCGPCPKCGGRDRFIVWPEHPSGATGGKFLCRGCAPEGGDGIQFLRDFMSMSYAEACEALRVEARMKLGCETKKAEHKPAWSPESERVPSEAWMKRAASLLAECQKNLTTSSDGQAELKRRGLSMQFALRRGLGWNPADRFEAPEAWGLEPWKNAKGNPGKLFIPAGLVIPTFRKAGPVAIKIRRRDWKPEDTWPKYHMLKGSGNGALFLGKPGQPVVLVESELDALLIAQEASYICAVMALGSAQNRPHIPAASLLKSSPCILVALDFDKPDDKGQRPGTKAWLWWRDNFRNAKRWPPAQGKDPGEQHAAGQVSLLVWIEAGLALERKKQAAPTMLTSVKIAAEQPCTVTGDPTKAQLDHASNLLVFCRANGRKIHVWHCTRCGSESRCTAWWHIPAVEMRFQRSATGKTFSAELAEKLLMEAVQ